MKGLLRNNPIVTLIVLSIVLVFISYVSAAELSGINGSAFRIQTSDLIDKFSLCRQVNKLSGSDVFVPTKTQAEWQSFINKVTSGLPGVSMSSCSYTWQTGAWGACSLSCGGGTQTRSVWCERMDGTSVSTTYCGGGQPASSQSCNTQSCCDANYGNACTSSANACGQTNAGTIQCNGSCSASTPANPAGYGNACSATSAANACGQTNTNYGTIQCNGSCSASTPSAPANPAGYGNACNSAANSCGMTNSGTIQCNGSCSASTPSDALCPAGTCPARWGWSACPVWIPESPVGASLQYESMECIAAGGYAGMIADCEAANTWHLQSL